MKLLTTSEYLADAAHAIARSKKRVVVMTLCIARETGTVEFIDNLQSAAKRGVDVQIAADTFTFSEFGGFFNPAKRWVSKSREARRLANRLRKNGASFYWLGGNHRINPFAGVTHVKWTIVDDVVYCFGGMNLYGKASTNLDYMFKVKDKKLANLLFKEHNNIVKSDKDPTDYSGFIKNIGSNKIMIDSGQPGESIIYDRAVELAKQADSILFVSQYCPTGELAKILRKKKAKVYYNRPGTARRWTNLMLRFSALQTKLKTRYKGRTYLHAKFIIFTMPGGDKITLSGSHNFSYSGVRFGTREVELETSDRKIISQLEEFYTAHIS